MFLLPHHRAEESSARLVGLATPSVTNVGCARASYTTDAGWAEVLVCNYGPIGGDATEPAGCATPSRRYTELCREL